MVWRKRVINPKKKTLKLLKIKKEEYGGIYSQFSTVLPPRKKHVLFDALILFFWSWQEVFESRGICYCR